jgi:SpoVK/Ycf46/Vps4 family AAA+-type ATPase
MPTSKQLKLLVTAFYENDNEKFQTIALQIAAHESRIGHSKFAKELRDLVQNSTKTLNRINTLSDENVDFFEFSLENIKLSQLITESVHKERINKILLEYLQREKLRDYGLSNRRKILLEGAPGTGKTMTASIIASELKLPLYKVQMHNLVTKYMGETSSKLRKIFDSINNTQGVYFFDEFDAIGTERGNDSDVGEMRRVLNSFLQFIEQDNSSSIIIAATNNSQLLDYALFRRFDDVIHYSLPTKTEIKLLYKNRLTEFVTKLNGEMEEIVDASISLSHAEISRICDDVLKDSLLENRNINKEVVLRIIDQRKKIYKIKK